MTILVLSDSHISPKYSDVDIWKAIAEFVVQHKPEAIVHLGDVADFDSLAWLKAARGLFTYEEELDHVAQHLHAFEDILLEDRMTSRKYKKKIYKPRKILCLGNHDVRNGATGIADMFKDCGWEVYDYLVPAKVGNISFCHTMVKGLSDNPCVTAEELIQNWHGNIVVGHSHVQDYSESFSIATGEKIKAIKCPAFCTAGGDWAVQTRNKWARGFTIIRTNPFEFMWKDISCLKKTS